MALARMVSCAVRMCSLRSYQSEVALRLCRIDRHFESVAPNGPRYFTLIANVLSDNLPRSRALQ